MLTSLIEMRLKPEIFYLKVNTFLQQLNIFIISTQYDYANLPNWDETQICDILFRMVTMISLDYKFNIL